MKNNSKYQVTYGLYYKVVQKIKQIFHPLQFHTPIIKNFFILNEMPIK